MVLRLFFIGLLFGACECQPDNTMTKFMPDQGTIDQNYYSRRIEDIALPGGFSRINDTPYSFTHWLRGIRLKHDRTVYLYNGERKKNQSAQFAVLDIPLGKKDLQQCADAVMRLRAQYLFDSNRYHEIIFWDNAGTAYRYAGVGDSLRFEQYLERVFAWCGTASLQKQLSPVNKRSEILPGDVLIKGGAPGHAVMVMDVAVNATGRKIYLLAQSYMPAQDIHLLVNPANPDRNPWYEVDDNERIITPEWVFSQKDLRRW